MAVVRIILLNFNSTRFTKQCIRSLLQTKEKSDTYQIVVWDNASTQSPDEKEIGFSEMVKLVTSKENLGFAAGNNEAVKRSYSLFEKKPDYLLILNNDTRVTKGMIASLIRTFESTPNAGIVVPKIYFEQGHEFHHKDYIPSQRGRVIWYAGGGIDWSNVLLFHKGVDEVDRGQFDPQRSKVKSKLFTLHTSTLVPSDFATGCCMLIAPNIWKKLGGFDPAYFVYYEDADLSMRLSKLQKKIVFDPAATLFHINAGSSSGSGSSVHVYYQTRNRLRFGLHYASFRTKLALLLEAKRQYLSGTPAQKVGILHALGGQWGNQTHKIPVDKP